MVSKLSKILLLTCGLILIVIGVPRLILQTWLPYSNYLFYVCLALFVLSIVVNYKIILEFFTMRTTKYGLNMGTMVLLGLLLFLGVNFIGTRYDSSIDITSEGLNSLSLQSKEVLNKLKDKVEFHVYHQGNIHKNQIISYKLLFKKYIRETDKIETDFIDAHKDPSARKYLTEADKGEAVIIVKSGERFERVKAPVDENSLTSAIYRLKQGTKKVIYFATGHGEKPLEFNQEGTSVSELQEELRDKGFQIKEFNFLQAESVPEDASMLALVGPQKSFLDHEVSLVRNYIEEQGGHLLLALDSSSELDGNEVFSDYGIEFSNTYVLTTQPVAGGDALAIAAQSFSDQSTVTDKLKNNAITLFYETQSIKPLENKRVEAKTLVTSIPAMIPVQDLNNYKAEIEGKKPKALSLAVLSEGGVDHSGHDHEQKALEEQSDSDFKIIAFGDSDFLTDVYLNTGFNKDLALNSFAYLAGENDLVSIQPKEASNTELILTSTYSAFIIIFPILIPLISLILTAVLWFRRRSA